VRAVIEKESAVIKKILENDVGYARITAFDHTTGYELDKALKSFKSGRVVIDLRGNPGGEVYAALEVMHMFSNKKSDIMLTIKGRKNEAIHTVGQPRASFTDPDKCTKGKKFSCKPRVAGKYAHYKLVVLIDDGSASASEIVSGTLKDWGKPIVADNKSGCRSYGKGVGQNLIPLSDGSRLRLTTFRFMVGNKKTEVHEVGISGTICVDDSDLTAIDPSLEENPMVKKALEILSEQ
jgi:carboxyl-terminal processing protease